MQGLRSNGGVSLYIAIVVLTVIVLAVGLFYINSSRKEDSGNQQSSQTQTSKNYSAQNVVSAISKAGLPITQVEDQEIGGTEAPATEIGSKKFVIPSIAPDGGQILIFQDEAGLNSKKTWFDRFPDLAPYVYIKGNAIVQLNSSLPVSEALKYKRAVEDLP